jgi:hypothetical protein
MPEWNVCGRGFNSRRLHHASPFGLRVAGHEKGTPAILCNMVIVDEKKRALRSSVERSGAEFAVKARRGSLSCVVCQNEAGATLRKIINLI